MNKKNEDIYLIHSNPFFDLKGRNKEKFMSMYQRIARRDIDNTHKVNGIS